MLRREELGTDSFVIAEVGQNHQGDPELARKYVKVFAANGADAVKFQTRNNRFLFSSEAYGAAYNSENAFAETYGAHREKLELDPSFLPALKACCRENNVKFMSTPFDEPSLEILIDVGVDIIKVASFDLGNLPFISKIAKAGKPVVISIGGGKTDQIKSSVEILLEQNCEVAVLHCVSEYPCEASKLGLDNIPRLMSMFPSCTIGLSDHFNGTLSGPIAYMKGARVFEKHVTMNRAWKGTDHSFALEPDGFRRFARDIRRVPVMMPPKPDAEVGTEMVFKKLGKSLIAARDIRAGEPITVDVLSGRIFSKQFIPVREANRVIGRKAQRAIAKGEPLTAEDLAP